MVKRSQVSPEFIISALLFLSMMLAVFSSLTRTYFLYTGDYKTENAYMLAEKYMNLLLAKQAPSNWTEDPFSSNTLSLGINGTLEERMVKKFGALSYPQVKSMLGATHDFNIEIRYLPSLSVVPFYSTRYPAGNITMSAEVRDIEDNPVNVTVWGILMPQAGKAQVLEASQGFGKYFWFFSDVASGHYQVQVVALQGRRYGITEFEVDVT